MHCGWVDLVLPASNRNYGINDTKIHDYNSIDNNYGNKLKSSSIKYKQQLTGVLQQWHTSVCVCVFSGRFGAKLIQVWKVQTRETGVRGTKQVNSLAEDCVCNTNIKNIVLVLGRRRFALERILYAVSNLYFSIILMHHVYDNL